MKIIIQIQVVGSLQIWHLYLENVPKIHDQSLLQLQTPRKAHNNSGDLKLCLVLLFICAAHYNAELKASQRYKNSFISKNVTLKLISRDYGDIFGYHHYPSTIPFYGKQCLDSGKGCTRHDAPKLSDYEWLFQKVHYDFSSSHEFLVYPSRVSSARKTIASSSKQYHRNEEMDLKQRELMCSSDDEVCTALALPRRTKGLFSLHSPIPDNVASFYYPFKLFTSDSTNNSTYLS